jgi:hypothetical protein
MTNKLSRLKEINENIVFVNEDEVGRESRENSWQDLECHVINTQCKALT